MLVLYFRIRTSSYGVCISNYSGGRSDLGRYGVCWTTLTYVESRPESAADITTPRGIGISHKQPANVLLSTDCVSIQGRISQTVGFGGTRNTAGRLDSRSCSGGTRMGIIRLLQLTAQLPNETLEGSDSIHDLWRSSSL